MSECDFAIVGAGIIGAAVAYKLTQRQPGARVIALPIKQDVTPGLSTPGFIMRRAAIKPVFAAPDWSTPLNCAGNLVCPMNNAAS